MSSGRCVGPLHLEIGPSRWLSVLLVAAHAGALAVLPPLSLGSVSKWTLALLILTSLSASWRAYRKAGVLVWEADGRWVWRQAGATPRYLDLIPGYYVSPWLVILAFRLTKGGRRERFVLLRDTLRAGSFRRLRVRLRLDAARPSSGYPR